MKNTILMIALILTLAAAAAYSSEEMTTYKNEDFGYSVDYPSSYQAAEIKWINESTGITLSGKNGNITVRAMPTGTNYDGMSFDQYVRIAASSEIQNFDRLVSIESFNTGYMVEGYKTWWEVVNHEDTDRGEIKTSSISGPIYYFAPEIAQKLSGQPVKTIMISCYFASRESAALKSDMDNIAKSFRYLASIKMFFKKGSHGKQYAVNKGKPFRIELPSNPTTGYNWYVANFDEDYFKMLSSGYEPVQTKLVGSGGINYWEVMPVKEGASQIKILYYRPWEGPSKAVDEYSLKILIK